MLCELIYIIFSKGQNCDDGERISCQETKNGQGGQIKEQHEE